MKVKYMDDHINTEQTPFTDDITTDIIVHLMVIFISIISTLGGIGGGGMMVPLFMSAKGFSVKEAVPLSVATIFGSSITKALYYYPKVNPLHQIRRLLYFSPIMILVPFIANSSFVGAILSVIFPDTITIICIVLVLGYTGHKTLLNGIKTYKMETLANNNGDNDNGDNDNGDNDNGDNDNGDNDNGDNDNGDNDNGDNDNNANTNDEFIIDSFRTITDTITKRGDREYEMRRYALLTFLSVFLVGTFSVTRELLDKCSNEYIYHILGQLITVIISSIFITRYVKKDYNNKIRKDYHFIQGDIKWTNKIIIWFTIIGTLTGIITTCIGIGGSLIINPILIQYKVIPQVVIASGAITTMTSSFISVVNYIALDRLIWKYSLTFICCSTLGTSLGLYILDKIIQKIQRQSTLIFILVTLIGISMITMVVNMILNSSSLNFEFSNYCDKN
jgi:uncharacterized membrane protein YfcA